MPKKLPYNDFINSFKGVPRVAISLAVVFRGKVLLTTRKVEPFKDKWHLPGSFILKDETMEECLLRVGEEELGVDLKKNKVFLAGIYENLYGDPRGHIIEIIYFVKLREYQNVYPERSELTAEYNFFDSLPIKEDVGFHPDIVEDIFDKVKEVVF